MSPRVFSGRGTTRARLKRFEVQLVFTRSMTCTLKARSATVAREIAEELYTATGNRAFISDDETLVRYLVTEREGAR